MGKTKRVKQTATPAARARALIPRDARDEGAAGAAAAGAGEQLGAAGAAASATGAELATLAARVEAWAHAVRGWADYLASAPSTSDPDYQPRRYEVFTAQLRAIETANALHPKL